MSKVSVLAARPAKPGEIDPGLHSPTPDRSPRWHGSWRASLLTPWRWPIQWRTSRRVFRQQRARLREHPLFAACSNAELKILLRWGDEAAVPSGVELLHEDGLG